MAKKQRKGRVEITLKKAGAGDIVIESCPEKVKMGFGQTLLETFYGMPPLYVKPKDWKGAGIIWGAFAAALILGGTFATINGALAIILLCGFLGVTWGLTKNYFFNFIRKKIAEGYAPATEEQRQILLNAGIYAASTNAQAQNVFQMNPAHADKPALNYADELEKLAGLRDKGILTQEEFDAQKAKILGQ